MLTLLRGASLAFLLFGCADERPKELADSTVPTLFVCGCTPCNELVRASERAVLGRCTIFYRGSPGDARKLSLLVDPPLDVKSDPRGEIAKQHGVETCPALVIWDRNGKRSVLGNGKPLTAKDLSVSTEGT